MQLTNSIEFDRITNSKFIILNSYLAFARTIIRKRIFKITTMGLFDFLFGSDESSTNGLFDIEDYRSIHEDRRHHASGSGNWTSREDWDCGDYDDDGMSGFDSYEDNDF